MRDDVMATRLHGFGTTIFAEMTALARRTGAINLGQGFPDTDGPAAMLAAARDAIAAGLNQYPPGDGMPELRTAVAEQRSQRYGMDYDPDREVLVTAGATEAITAALLGLCNPGDEVVVFEPYYDSYMAAIAMAGGIRRPVQLRAGAAPDDAFGFDPDELRAAITPRTRLMVFNSPHNPTGKVFTRAELELIASVCQEHDLIAITDEVYEYLTFDGLSHIPLATIPGMRDRTVAVSSAGKTFSVTGWKIGWVCGPPNLVTAVRAAKQFMTFASGTPFQVAVAYALREELAWVEELRQSLAERRDLLRDGLVKVGFHAYPSQGTYFVMTDARSLGYEGGRELCLDLPERAGVVAIPAAVFYDDKQAGGPLVRFAFCKKHELLDEASSRLAALKG